MRARLALVSFALVCSLAGVAEAQPEPKPKYPPIRIPDDDPDTPPPDAAPPADAPPEPAPKATPKAGPADEPVMTKNTHPMWVALGFGPAVGIVGCVRRLCNTDEAYTQFKISEDFGYHVSGSDGFAVGANLQQAFSKEVFRLTAAFKMWWDAPLSDDLALYLTPMLSVGYSLLHFDFGDLGTITDHAFNTQGGLGVRMVLVDRAIVYVRPITADVSINQDGVALFYDIAVGGGVTFSSD